MKEFWIIGGGKFGLRAAEAMRRMAPQAEILIVEKDPDLCRRLQEMNFRTLCTDGIDFLATRLQSPAQKVWLVAAAPVHVAYEWIRLRVSGSLRLEPMPVPAELARQLPNALPGGKGQMFTSNADFICPEDCKEAGRLCTATGRPRPRSMHVYLRELPHPGVKKIVVRSFQLSAGVGGLRPSDLFSALANVRTSTPPILLATACKCHAVINLFNIISNS